VTTGGDSLEGYEFKTLLLNEGETATSAETLEACSESDDTAEFIIEPETLTVEPNSRSSKTSALSVSDDAPARVTGRSQSYYLCGRPTTPNDRAGGGTDWRLSGRVTIPASS